MRNVDPQRIQLGPPDRSKLTDDQVARIRAFKDTLGDLDPSSLEDTLDNFSRDLRPEREIQVWERIAANLAALMQTRPPEERKPVYTALMAMSFWGLDADALTRSLNGERFTREFVQRVVDDVIEAENRGRGR